MSPEVVEATSRLRAWLDSFPVRFTLSVIAVLSLLVTAFNTYHNVAYARCLAGYNNRTSAVSVQRSQANQTTTDAIDVFIRTVVNNGTLPRDQQKTAFVNAYDNYLKARSAADEQRKLNPLPAPPSETCR